MAGYPSAGANFASARALLLLLLLGVISWVMGTATILVTVDRLVALSFPCRAMQRMTIVPIVMSPQATIIIHTDAAVFDHP